MVQFISAIALVVPCYEAAKSFYVDKLGFVLIEDTVLSDTKRWVIVAPNETAQTRLLLAKADAEAQLSAIGNQTGGRVFLFLETHDFEADMRKMTAAGVKFLENPRHENYGKVVVFEDPFVNKWDLI
ncbi:VOC family protein, partial [Roseibium hamelinense]